MLRGMMGYGAASRIHTAKILRLSEDLPIVVEIVDSKEKITALLPTIEEMVEEGLVTLENVRVSSIEAARETEMTHIQGRAGAGK